MELVSVLNSPHASHSSTPQSDPVPRSINSRASLPDERLVRIGLAEGARGGLVAGLGVSNPWVMDLCLRRDSQKQGEALLQALPTACLWGPALGRAGSSGSDVIPPGPSRTSGGASSVIPESSLELILDLGHLGPGATLTLRPG